MDSFQLAIMKQLLLSDCNITYEQAAIFVPYFLTKRNRHGYTITRPTGEKAVLATALYNKLKKVYPLDGTLEMFMLHMGIFNKDLHGQVPILDT